MIKNQLNRMVLYQLGLMAAALLCFFIIRGAILYYMNDPDLSAAQDEATEQLDSLVAAASEKNRGGPSSIALQEEALSRFNKDFRQEKSADKRYAMAADAFWGFYFLNTKYRPRHCAGYGVDIIDFVRRFEEAHADQRKAAEKIYKNNNMDTGKLLRATDAQMQELIKIDMADISKTLKVGEKEACEILRDSAAKIVPDMDIRRRAPHIHDTLEEAAKALP